MQENLKIFLVIIVTMFITMFITMLYKKMYKEKIKRLFIRDMNMIKLPVIANVAKTPVVMSDDMIQKLYQENKNLIRNVYWKHDLRKLFQDTIKLSPNSIYKMSCFEEQMLVKFFPMLLTALGTDKITTISGDVIVYILVSLAAKIAGTTPTPATSFGTRLTNILVAGADKSMIQPPIVPDNVRALVTASGLQDPPTSSTVRTQSGPDINWSALMTATKNLLVSKTYNVPNIKMVLSMVVPILSYETSLITPLNDPFCDSIKNSTASISQKNITNSLISSLINLYSTTVLAKLGPS